MKLNTAVMKSLLMAASVGAVVPLVVMAQTPPKPVAPKKEKAEPPPKIKGITIPRANGHFLGITVDGVHFTLRFYDEKKKPETPDAPVGAVRWNPISVKSLMRVPLNPSADGMALLSPDVVRPPLTFTAYFTLLTQDGKPLDVFSVDLNELPPADASPQGPIKGY